MDDFGCALFGPVLFVTLSYYGLQFLPLDPLYGDDYQVVRVASSVLNLQCLQSCGPLPASVSLSSLSSCSEVCTCTYRLQPLCRWYMFVSHTDAELLAELIAELPAKLPVELPAGMLAELLAELPADLPAELLAELPVSGVCPDNDKDCLLSGERTPSTAAGLLPKRHLCKSSRPSLPSIPSHTLEYLVMALVSHQALQISAFQGLHIQNMPLLHACNEHKP